MFDFERPTASTLLRRTSATLSSGFVPFFSLAVIVQSPILFVGILELATDTSLRTPDPQNFHLGVVAVGCVLNLLLAVLLNIASAAMVLGVFKVLRGEPMSISDCLALAASRWDSVIGLAILTALAVAGGFVLCIIPGIVIACSLAAASPALMVEKLRATDAMKRSWSLTDGYKVSIFAALLVIGVIQWVLAMGAVTLPDMLLGPVPARLVRLLSAIASLLANGFTTALSAVAASVIYHDIRLFREDDLGEDDLAAVFD